MTDVFIRLWNDSSGATAIEYAMIAAGVALAVVSAVNTLGQSVLTNKFQVINTSLSP